jgi:hypothetical protein
MGWTNAGPIGKALVVVWFIAITSVYGSLMNVHPYYEYLRPRMIVGWIYLWTLFVLLPFSVATMAQKRGRHFNKWFVCSCLFAPLPYFIYLFKVRKSPIVTPQNSPGSNHP